jgi:hypothetical protein
MAKTISVKIPTATLIAEIEASIAQIKTEIENYSANYAKYEVDVEQWKENVVAHAQKALNSIPPTQWGTDGHSSRDKKVNVSFSPYAGGRVEIAFSSEELNFPKRPEAPNRPNEKQHFGREYTSRLEILERNLKILKMSNQDEVNASTYSSLMGVL